MFSLKSFVSLFFCLPVGRCSDGEGCERKILCVCDGTAAHADVSAAPDSSINHRALTFLDRSES